MDRRASGSRRSRREPDHAARELFVRQRLKAILLRAYDSLIPNSYQELPWTRSCVGRRRLEPDPDDVRRGGIGCRSRAVGDRQPHVVYTPTAVDVSGRIAGALLAIAEVPCKGKLRTFRVE